MKYKHLDSEFGTVLKMDIDTNYIPFFAFKGLQLVSRNYTLQHLIIKRSPSKKHYHIIACLKERLSNSEIILAQLICGSDKYRERHNWLRHINNNDIRTWNLLFSMPKEKRTKITLPKINCKGLCMKCPKNDSMNCINPKYRIPKPL